LSLTPILDLPRAFHEGRKTGIPSICTAHPVAIEAALLEGKARASAVLIEATCNQVNQDGGYTGMTPADFRRFVEAIADRVGFDRQRLILGGDHLGPNPWTGLDAQAAMDKAKVMIDAFARAGFTKLHLDTSMGCLGEAQALPDEITAQRAAELAVVAEAAQEGGSKPCYVIGTEVPVPGGAWHALDHLIATKPEAVLQTVEIHRDVFARAGVSKAFDRAIGVVVQPGVEFGNADIVPYRRAEARTLSAVLSRMPQFVFEAHSTDYQSPENLKALVEDGFAILKVGPWLTFALREALYGLDAIAEMLAPSARGASLRAEMERLMTDEPGSWAKYYEGDAEALRLQRHFSYSDRIRYYWPHVRARRPVELLTEVLDGREIPETLISQYLPRLYPAVASGRLQARPRDLQLAAVRLVLALYADACGA
jgi:D-tagatose 6-phosphate 4-epimerase